MIFSNYIFVILFVLLRPEPAQNHNDVCPVHGISKELNEIKLWDGQKRQGFHYEKASYSFSTKEVRKNSIAGNVEVTYKKTKGGNNGYEKDAGKWVLRCEKGQLSLDVTVGVSKDSYSNHKREANDDAVVLKFFEGGSKKKFRLIRQLKLDGKS